MVGRGARGDVAYEAATPYANSARALTETSPLLAPLDGSQGTFGDGEGGGLVLGPGEGLGLGLGLGT